MYNGCGRLTRTTGLRTKVANGMCTSGAAHSAHNADYFQMRKMVHNLLNQNVAQNYVPYQMLENKQMLYDLLDTPQDFLKHIRRYSNALTTSMVFGWRTPTYHSPAMEQLFDGFSEFAEINQTGTAALIDFFPLLRNLPDWVLPTQRKARELHKAERELYLSHWLRAKDEIRKGTISQCFCVGMEKAQEKDGFDDAQAVSRLTQSKQALLGHTHADATLFCRPTSPGRS